MNREILFRGKREYDGKWIRGYYFFYYDIIPRNPDLNGSYIVNMSGKYFKVDRKTVGQFTGSCDKNGKEIFDGDILKSENNIFIVKWLEDKAKYVCSFMDIEGYYCELNDRYIKANFVVCGNIHDNQQLLGGEDAKN